ncbi:MULTISPECIES: FliM/FliN family flagellar motor C-terminal domain-containing protein [unclassified Paracoccus (in: a-proteobacteria)]|uniref:FliM/FliN family flagellar motor C-terminal domain-containing protein n=1 Tax=unclassified Paracoccus (in: a-proteobacteria) TaxID=2688777 RepID=UPI0012B19C1F|nr:MULTISPECIES: FliM/FliN family flagellar motor C-terminal domain-containing protein [unclassified Paracoccus (in: a-proteobacteria)]UXU74098.1 FliM/FliN family flagellar motor C-terminal domain-containing protein [Paracoccus sp. SMMA_5]UXU79988.1 FliM/FliN family flagellar motor C-terminal domain-containing protein [Paracoccus sp. SMMA_5_TC]
MTTANGNGLQNDGGGGSRAQGASVLLRMIAASSAPSICGKIGRAIPDPQRAAGIALGRAAERHSRLPLTLERVDRSVITTSELSELLPERALFCVVSGASDSLGVVALCSQTLASLIEMQALGRIAAKPASPRRPTRTDAVICSEFVDLLLSELAREQVLGLELTDAPETYRYATYLDDPRPLMLMLEDAQMLHLSLHFRMGHGAQRAGHVVVALPSSGAGTIPARTETTAIAAPAPLSPDTGDSSRAMVEAVQGAPVRLRGILCRRRISLGALRGLGPGSLLPLPLNTLENARVETMHGQLLAVGRLGEAEGYHALRLRHPQGVRDRQTQDQKPPAPLTEPPLDDLAQADPFRRQAETSDNTLHAHGT